MKSLLIGSTLLLALAINVMASEWAGYMADSSCAKKMSASAIASAAHADCAKKCIKMGSKVVLVTDDGKVYQIADQDKAKPFVGAKVTIEGAMDGDTIKATKIKM